MKEIKNRGFSLIELIISIAILSVVGLAVAGLFGSSARMYHSTITYADVQTESQTVSRRLAAMIMDAENIYYEDTDAGMFLFTGKRTPGNATVQYAGEILWLNKTNGHLYQSNTFTMESSLSDEQDRAEDENGALTLTAVEKALTGKAGADNKEFLISSMGKALELTVDAAVIAPENKEKDSPNFYKLNQNITFNYTLTMKYLDGKDYTVSSAATPRNKLGFLRYREEYEESDKNRSFRLK